MHQRVKVLIGFAVLLGTSGFLQAAQRPNIILAMADDQGWRDVGYNAEPGKVVITPHMDQMAKEGIRFNRFYSASPNCAPTRAGFLTGRQCNRSGVFNPGFALRPEEVTIAEILQKAGYATAHFGKWHLGPVKADSSFNPGKQGFDHYLSHDNFFEINPELSRNGADPEKFTGDGSEIIADETLKFIDSVKDSGKPFLTVVWFGSPHKPHKPLEQYKNMYPDLPEDFQNYFGEITGMDSAMGMIREGLKERGLDQNTLVWYTSDNGSHKPMDEITGLRGCKGSTWEGGIRVPSIIVWPGHIEPVETEMVGNTVDILPTVMDLLDIQYEGRVLDGISLLPLLQGKEMVREKPMGFWRASKRSKEGEKDPRYTDEELTGWWRTSEVSVFDSPQTDGFAGDMAWIEGRWKLHKMRGDTYELYDLEADQAETTDLSGKMPEVVETLAAHLNDWQMDVEESLCGRDYKQEPKLTLP